MSEYLEWREDGGPTVVRVHRRVVAGLEREPAGELHGIALGAVSEDGHAIDIEDFEVLPPGAEPGGGHSLIAVGSFRVAADAERLTDADRECFARDLPGRSGVLLLFQRDGQHIEWNDVALQPASAHPEPGAAPPESRPAPLPESRSAPLPESLPAPLPEGRRAARLDDTGEHVAARRPRYFWPAVVAGAAALIIGAAYVTADRDARRHDVSAASKAPPPLADWKPVDPPAAPTVPPPVSKAAPTTDADRLTDAGHADTPADKAQIKQQIRDTLEEWRKSLLSQNVDQYTSLYAASVGPYFRENRVSRAQIAGEVRRMLGRYGPMTAYRISDVTVAPVDENHAIANFRKEWRTARNAFSGAEKAQLRFERQNGKWLITSEQELHVYWARRR